MPLQSTVAVLFYSASLLALSLSLSLSQCNDARIVVAGFCWLWPLYWRHRHVASTSSTPLEPSPSLPRFEQLSHLPARPPSSRRRSSPLTRADPGGPTGPCPPPPRRSKCYVTLLVAWLVWLVPTGCPPKTAVWIRPCPLTTLFCAHQWAL